MADAFTPATGLQTMSARSRFKTRFRRENEQFGRLARSENEEYLENILSLSEAAGRPKGRSQQKLGFRNGF